MNFYQRLSAKKNFGLFIFLGVAVGFTFAAGFLPGGYDAYFHYLRPYPNNTPVPPWIFLLTTPLSWLGPPLSWQALIFITILAAGIAARMWGNKNWWVAVFSAPMLLNLWLGQIEGLEILGLIVATLVVQKRAHPAWLGFAWLVLLVKPQVGLGMVLLLAWWVLRDQGLKAILYSIIPIGFVIILITLLWPDWLMRWIVNTQAHMQAIQTIHIAVTSVWPYGLISIPLALIPRNVSHAKRLRMVAAATLLSSPYLTLYHVTALMTLTASPFALALSWLLVLPAQLILPDTWMRWGWTLPAAILLVDFVRCYFPVNQDNEAP